MQYLLDLKSSPPVVVLQVRPGTPVDQTLVHHLTAQQYADQTGHVLVWADGPDSVLDPNAAGIVHPTAHQPAPANVPTPVAGLGVPPASLPSFPPKAMFGSDQAAANLGGVWSWLKGEAKALEGPAEDLAKQLLNKLLTELFK